MGSKAKKEELKKPEVPKAKNGQDDSMAKLGQKGKKPANVDLSKIEVQEELTYKPRDKETKWIYDQMLHIVSEVLGDQPISIKLSALDEVLAVLRDDSKRDSDKISDVSYLLGSVPEETFSTLLNFSKMLTDYVPVAGKSRNENEDDLHKYEQEHEYNLNLADAGERQPSFREALEEKSGRGTGQEEEITHFVQENDEEASETTEKEQMEEEEHPQPKRKVIALEKISMEDITDPQWLQRTMIQHGISPESAQMIEEQVLEGLVEPNQTKLTNSLVVLLGGKTKTFELIKMLVKNAAEVYVGLKLQKAELTSHQEAQKLKASLSRDPRFQRVFEVPKEGGRSKMDIESEVAESTRDSRSHPDSRAIEEEVSGEGVNRGVTDAKLRSLPKKFIDIEKASIITSEQAVPSEKISLPAGSKVAERPGFQEIYIPAMKRDNSGVNLISIASLPRWARGAFGEAKNLNVIQSKVFETAFRTPENMLVCAPTGAGKTNIAMLTILNQIGLHRRQDGSIDKNKFKIVYIAPMKALVTEVVGNLSRRLESFDLKVRELTGDSALSKSQIEETQVIVATPEKWDIITRKCGDRSYSSTVKLIIIDEIHLLHDVRGPVLETIVARTIRQVETTSDHVRIVGLSATLPNYQDVASLLRVPRKGLFYFDGSYRPVPLEQVYIGITEKRGIKKFLLMNEILYQKVMERIGKYQILVFVHSRRETVKTAKALKEMAFAKDELSKIVKEGTASKTILEEQSKLFQNSDLKDLAAFGIGVHHAGLSKLDRKLAEDLFDDTHLRILVSTSTLAWGVNLPAHTVIIKGTQVYSAEEGGWKELSPQDMLQMMGRAGRPAYDTSGEGIIITTYKDVKFYLSLINSQLPIESQFQSHLADQLNAEIVAGSIGCIKDGVNWLGYTYFIIRARECPSLYGLTFEEVDQDPDLIGFRLNLIHSACVLLDKYGLIRYDVRSGELFPTTLGKIASNYYIRYPSIARYNQNINPFMGVIDILRVFSISEEFKNVPIREDEKVELYRLTETVPIPIKGASDDPSSKINVLLQAYISRMRLEGFALNSDMVYITQSASRISRALFEIFLRKGWGQVAQVTLNIAKMIDRRQWSCSSPLRQFNVLPENVLQRIERKEQLTFDHFFVMTQQQVCEVVKSKDFGKSIYQMIHQFPRVSLDAYIQPLTPSCLRVKMKVMPSFQWEDSIHTKSEPFWLFVEDGDGENILYSEFFTLVRKGSEIVTQVFEFTVPLFKTMHPQYFIKVVSDRWLSSETQIPIVFSKLIQPAKFPECTELLNFPLISSDSVADRHIREVLEKLKIRQLNQIQTQVYSSIMTSNDSIFLGAAQGSGKGVCSLIACINCLVGEGKSRGGKLLVLAEDEIAMQTSYEFLEGLLRPYLKWGQIACLTGVTATDIKLLESQVIFSSACSFDNISRRPRQRKLIESIDLVVVDQIHKLCTHGAVFEACVSRLRRLFTLSSKKLSLFATAVSVADWKDLADWLGVDASRAFNFHQSMRPVPLKISLVGFDQPDRRVRIQMMSRHLYHAVARKSSDKPVVIFTADRKESRLTALDLVSLTCSDSMPYRFISVPASSREGFSQNIPSSDPMLIHCLSFGVGFYFSDMTEEEKTFILSQFESGVIRVLVTPYKEVSSLEKIGTQMVVIADTTRWDGEERRYVEYEITELLSMVGKGGRHVGDKEGQAIVMCYEAKKEYYKRFLFEPMPLESQMHTVLPDHLNGEINSKVIKSVQDCIDWVTWTFMYRRLAQNPNYYNMQGTSGLHINDYLSEIIENALEELEKIKCIGIDESGSLSINNFGMIAAHYYIKVSTMELYSTSVDPALKLKHVIELLSRSSEFDVLDIRYGEEALLKQLYSQVPIKMTEPMFNYPDTKTHLLLQAHFSRISLNSDLEFDQRLILVKMPKLIQTLIDVFSSNSWLKPALFCIQLSQMVVQGIWNTDSQLLQLPHMTSEMLKEFQKQGVNDLVDFTEMDDEARKAILKLGERELEEVAEACNRFPDVQVKLEPTKPKITASQELEVAGKLLRESEEEVGKVYSPRFPDEKEEFWWVIIGEIKTNRLYGIKRLPLGIETKFELRIEIQEPGTHELTLFAYCDSYAGCEADVKFSVEVAEEDNEAQEDYSEPMSMEEEKTKTLKALPPAPPSGNPIKIAPPPQPAGKALESSSKIPLPPRPDEPIKGTLHKPQPPRPNEKPEHDHHPQQRNLPPRPPLPPPPKGESRTKMEIEDALKEIGEEEPSIFLSRNINQEEDANDAEDDE